MADFAVNTSSNQPSPLSEAMVWVSRILAVTAAMVLPGLAGQWLDKRWGASFLGIAGFILGLVSGMAYLLMMTKLPPAGAKGRRTEGQTGEDGPDDDKDSTNNGE